jgi:hypothetical protein
MYPNLSAFWIRAEVPEELLAGNFVGRRDDAFGAPS